MKKIFIILVVLSAKIFSQAPLKINYQGIARDAMGIPVSTINTVDLLFVISDASSLIVHNEPQSSIPISTLGIFNTKIGDVSALSNTISWQNGPYTLSVSIDIGNGMTFLGSQQLVSVPFALYSARSGGGGLPPGTRNGQTLRWDSIPGIWKIDNNLTNDGNHVGVGLFPAGLQSRLHVTTNSPIDTTVIFGFHPSIQSKGAAMRGIAVGNTPQSIINPFNTAIYGGNHSAINQGNGLGVGSFGFGSSNGQGMGVVGIGYGAGATSTAIGVYATSLGHPNAMKYAAIFDKGRVVFSDSVFVVGTNTGNIGYVLTYTNNGLVKWMPAGAGSGPWIQNLGFVNLNNNTDLVGIGTGTLMPSAKLDVLTAAGSTLTGIFSNASQGTGAEIRTSATNSIVSALRVVNFGEGDGVNALATSISNTNVAAVFGSNVGNGNGVFGVTASTFFGAAGVRGRSSGISAGVFGENTTAANSSLAIGVYGKTSNTNVMAAGVAGVNNGGGIGVLGSNNSATAAIVGVNQFIPSSSFAHGIYGVSSNSNLFASGMFGENKGFGYGVYGINSNSLATNAIGVYGLITNTSGINTSGVKGEASGFGNGVHGLNDGTGPGVRASAGTFTSSALSLLLDNGHIKSVQPNPPTFTTSAIAGGFTAPTATVIGAGSTDVKGNFAFVTDATGFSPTNFCDVQIRFTKPYSSNPIVNVTPTSDLMALSFMVSAVSLNSFTVRIYKPNGVGFPVTLGPSTFRFNYIVIE